MPSKNFKVYTASAGSGKTFQLTVDYLKIALREPSSRFKKILAITFTKKATNEMKARILEACKAFSTMNKIPLEGRNKNLFEKLVEDTKWTKEYIQQSSEILYKKIIHNYSDFSVSTIDSFTQRLLRSFAFELNIPINFEIELDQSETMELIVSRLLEKVGEKDKDLTTLVRAFFDDKLNEKDDLRIQNDFLDAAKLMLNEKSMEARTNLEPIELKTLISINEEISKRYFELKKQITQLGKAGIDALTAEGLSIKDTTRGSANFFEKLRDEKQKPEPSEAQLKKFNGEVSWFNKSSEYNGAAIDQKLSDLGKEYLQVLGKFKMVLLAKNSFTQVSLIAQLYRLYKQYQQEEDILLIAEANQLITNEIKGQPATFLYEKVGERYQHILIDEFQDTSILQWHNLTPLVTEILSQPGENDCIVVGDSKQAIYRFRGGETKQLTMLPRLIGDSEDVHLADQSRILESHIHNEPMMFNYRSDQIVVDFNNLLYKFIAEHKDLIGLNEIFKSYFQEPFQKNGKGYVQIDAIEHSTKKGEEDLNYEEKVNALVLEQIADIQSRGIPLGSVAILSRSNNHLKNLAKLLTENGYLIESQEALALENKKFIQLFFSIINLFYDRSNQVYQTEVATGFIDYNIIRADYATINSAIGKRKIKKLEDFDFLLNEYSNEHTITFNSIEISELLDILELYISWLPAEIQQSDYISFFRNVIFDFVKIHGNNIEGLLNWWQQKKAKLFIESTPNPEAIQLLTIHKSKGLEFDIVLMPFTNWAINYHGDFKWLPVKELSDLPIEKYYIPTSLTKLQYTNLEEVAQANVQDVLMDNLNILYVATTRAVKELYIITRKSSKPVTNLEKPSNISAIFNSFINDENFIRETYGEKVQGEKVELQQKDNFIIQPQIREFGKTDVVIKNRSSVIWSEDIQGRIHFGEIIHNLLEEVRTPQSITFVLNKALNEGLLKEEEQDKIKALIEEIVTHRELNEFFSTDKTILAEKSIITPEGKEYIPDRILIEDDGTSAKIIDFKTGILNDSHSRQLLNYTSLLESMGYNVIEKKLVYIDPLFIKQL